MADGKSPMEAAERAVSRSGDRWGAVYSRGRVRGVRGGPRRPVHRRRAVGAARAGRPYRGDQGAAPARPRPPPGSARATGCAASTARRSTGIRSPRSSPYCAATPRTRAAGTTVRLGLRARHARVDETLRRARLSTDSVTVRAARRRDHRHQGRRVHQGRRGPWSATPCAQAPAGARDRSRPARQLRRPGHRGRHRRLRLPRRRPRRHLRRRRRRSRPCTPSPAGTPPGPWSRSSTAAR